MYRLAFSVALAAVLSSGIARGQSTPDFTGTWRMDMSRSESAAQGTDASPRTPVTLTIAQTADHVTIETVRDGSRRTVKFPFAEVRAAVGTVGTDDVQPARVEWRGADLVTMTIYRVSGMAVKQIQTTRLDPSGREMMVETLLEMQHGYETNHPEYRAGAVTRDVYTRVDP